MMRTFYTLGAIVGVSTAYVTNTALVIVIMTISAGVAGILAARLAPRQPHVAVALVAAMFASRCAALEVIAQVYYGSSYIIYPMYTDIRLLYVLLQGLFLAAFAWFVHVTWRGLIRANGAPD